MAVHSKQSSVEWVGGLVKVPAYVCDDTVPYRPDALFWMDEHGVVLRSRVEKPGKLLGQAAESLRGLITEVQAGPHRAPSCVRVASRALAAELAAALPALEIVCAPTPEIDALLRSIREQFDQDAVRDQSYLTGGHDPRALAAFFEAAAGLFRTAPWHRIPSDQHLLLVNSETLDLHDAVLSVIGQLGKSVGWVLFSNSADFDSYLDAADALEHGQVPAMPAHFALHFERGAELSLSSRKEIARYAWPVAGAGAYPWLMAMDEDLIARPPTAAEVTMAEALARALPQLLAENMPALLSAWNGGAHVQRTLVVPTHAGDVSLSLQAGAGIPVRTSAVHTGMGANDQLGLGP